LNSSSERFAEVFVEFADTLVDEFDLIEFLQTVTVRTSQLVGADHAGLLLADPHGRLQFVAASDERTELLELFQVQSNEGPCQDCFRQGAPVINADLSQAGDRWPRFAPRAVRAGFRSVHAFPMRFRNKAVGALNLFSTSAVLRSPSDTRVIQALADVATIGLLEERVIRRGDTLSAQLQEALTSRIVIEQAKGVIAQRRNCSVGEAFDTLRTYCRNHGVALSTAAAAIVDGSTSIPALTARIPGSVMSPGSLEPVRAARLGGASRVFVCDDHPGIRQALSEVITGLQGFAMVGEAADGTSLLEALPGTDVDILILDFNMPGGGLPLVVQIRAIKPDIKILVFTAHGSDNLKSAMLAAGADEFVTKTGRLRALRDALRRISPQAAARPVEPDGIVPPAW